MQPDLAGTDSPSSSRALATVAAEAQVGSPHRSIRRAAPFLTHLIATAHKLPQARQRRRAEPAEVIAVYQAALARCQTANEKSP